MHSHQDSTARNDYEEDEILKRVVVNGFHHFCSKFHPDFSTITFVEFPSTSTPAKQNESQCESFMQNVTVSYLVGWYFEPSQPQRITSGLKQTSIRLSFTMHTSHHTTNSPESIRISPDTNLHKTKQTQI